MLPAVPWVNFRPGPPRAVGAPISPVNPLAPPPAAAVLSVEKGSPADARPHRPRQDTAPADLPVADKRVELRPGPRVARAVSRRRDLDHHAGIGRAVGSESPPRETQLVTRGAGRELKSHTLDINQGPL